MCFVLHARCGSQNELLTGPYTSPHFPVRTFLYTFCLEPETLLPSLFHLFSHLLLLEVRPDNSFFWHLFMATTRILTFLWFLREVYIGLTYEANAEGIIYWGMCLVFHFWTASKLDDRVSIWLIFCNSKQNILPLKGAI